MPLHTHPVYLQCAHWEIEDWGVELSLSPQFPVQRRFSISRKKFCKAFKLSKVRCYLLSAPAKGSIKQQRMAAGTVSTGMQKLGTIFQSRASPLQSEASGQHIQCYRHRLTPANQTWKKRRIIMTHTLTASIPNCIAKTSLQTLLKRNLPIFPA